MDFQLTDEQVAIEQLASSVFSDFCSDERIARLHQSGTKFDRELWGKLTETGLLATTVDSERGGVGLGMLELCTLLEQQGRFLAQVPLWRQQIVAMALSSYGTESAKKKHLPSLLDGSKVAALPTEFFGQVHVRAEPADGGYKLNGVIDSVLLAEVEELILVPAVLQGNLRFFIANVESDSIVQTKGTITNYDSIVDLRFANCVVDAQALLAESLTEEWLEQRMSACLSALQLGVIDEALRRAASYASERQQFGRPIGSFQGVAARMADSYTELELLRAVVWQLAWRIDTARPAVAEARVAKYQASQAGHIVGHTAMHYHGGTGADLSYPIHRFYLWSRALDLMAGGAEAQLERLGHALPAAHGPQMTNR